MNDRRQHRGHSHQRIGLGKDRGLEKGDHSHREPHRAPDDRAIIRCFLGGARGEQTLALSEEEILRIVREELDQILHLKAEPLFARVFKWKGAMAQYGVGHLERLQRIAAHRQKLSGLSLAGNGYSGIGVPDCVRSGTAAAEETLKTLGIMDPQSVTART